VAELRRDPTDNQIESEQLTAALNQNRIDFLRKELQTCFTLAGLAKTEQDLKDLEHAAMSLAHAEEAYATLVRFLSDSKHAKHITERDRVELTAGMKRVRDQLDKLGNDLR
jgi:hypothetical protein